MILLVSGATVTVARYSPHPHLGRFVQPANGNDMALFCAAPGDKGADNGMLNRDGFSPDRYLDMCDALRGCPGLRFVPAPDAVWWHGATPRGDWSATKLMFGQWRPALVARGLPIAIVAQDGAIVDDVPWDMIDALFIGGSTAWKEGAGAAFLIGAARHRNKWVHIGRINSLRRLNAFRTLSWLGGVNPNSFDGGQFSRFPDTYIPQWLDHLGQRTLEAA